MVMESRKEEAGTRKQDTSRKQGLVGCKCKRSSGCRENWILSGSKAVTSKTSTPPLGPHQTEQLMIVTLVMVY